MKYVLKSVRHIKDYLSVNFFNPWDSGNISNNNNNNNKKQFGGFGGGNGNFFNNIKKYFSGDNGFIFAAICLVFCIWLITGVYVVNQNEQGVVVRLGRYHRTSNPGLHFKFQYPFEKLYKVQTTTVHKMQIGYVENHKANLHSTGNMLTGDENIVDINFEIQWRIKDPKEYLFNISDQIETIKVTGESAMREVVGTTKIALILSAGRYNIEQEVKKTMQSVLDSYSSGVEIVLVQLLRADPPMEVIDAFRDVQTAKADKESKINQAQSYQNSIIPEAQGQADKIIQEALAYKSVVVSDAEGKAKRFMDIYNQYKNSKDITKKRIYLETMEKVMENNEVIVVDKSTASIMPYFNLNESKKTN